MMKNFMNLVVCGLLALGLGACSSREKLDDAGVKEHMETAGYTLSCVNSGEYACAYISSNKDKSIMNTESFGFVYLTSENIYSPEKGKVIDGSGEEGQLKKEYEEILDTADVKQDELKTMLDHELQAYKEKAEKEKAEAENKEFTAGERAVVTLNGIDKLAITFNSASNTEKRNQFDDSNPAQVVMINYSYENLAMDDDLYISSVSMTVMGDDGAIAKSYPISGEYPQKCPKGASSTGDEAFGFKTETAKVKVRVQLYVDSEKVTRTFVLDVQ